MRAQKKIHDLKWIHQQVGQYFRGKREELEYNQSDVARFLKIKVQYLSNAERGAGSLSNEIKRKLLDHYHVDPLDFLSFMLDIQEKHLIFELNIKKRRKKSS